MKVHYLLSGRIIYAIAMAAFGVICLVCVDFLNSLQPVPASMPGYGFLAVLTGLVLVLAGLAILADFKTYPAALALVVMFMLGIVVLHIPSAFIDPGLLRSPWWIRTFESLALAGAALILAGLADNPVRERWVRTGRIAFGISLPVFGILHFIYPDSVAALVAVSPVSYPWPLFWAYLTGAGHFAAGIAIATGMLSRSAAILVGIMYASWVLTLHLPRVISNPAARSVDNPVGYAGDRQELTSLFVCVAFWGAAWIVAASLAKQHPIAPAIGREDVNSSR
jgi:uncharacterized membrane protein YphA (DoxX/SURF4 family)